jgi:fatty acid desaturase
VLAIACFWLALAAEVMFGRALPTAASMVILAVLGCFYLSLQHEVIHGHPTPWRSLNKAFVVAPLSLIEPFSRYRQTHLTHHASDLTNPLVDPESHYVSPDVWRRAGTTKRLMLRANRTLAARMIIGPLQGTLRMWAIEVRALGSSRGVRRRWMLHLLGAAAVVFVLRAAGMSLWVYAVGFVFGGASLTALRSFLEHSAHEVQPRSAVVRSNWFFSLLFLNNNLHYTHHQMPGATWYRLPQLTRDLDAGALVAAGAGHYRGYLEIAKRHMFRPFCQPVNPLLEKIEA